MFRRNRTWDNLPGRVAQSVMCLTTDACWTADPGVVSLIPGWSHTFMEIAQSVTCLTTDTCRTADPGVASLILAWSHTFLEIDREKFFTVILLPSTESFKKGCCQLQAKVSARSTD